ncbi:hypothetical protein A2U01_0101426, partial [Trifolium medium]|nr:hypothetical protein [Trifolium medium]
MARCAVDAEKAWSCSVNCAPRRRGWRVAPVSWSDGPGRL